MNRWDFASIPRFLTSSDCSVNEIWDDDIETRPVSVSDPVIGTMGSQAQIPNNTKIFLTAGEITQYLIR